MSDTRQFPVCCLWCETRDKSLSALQAGSLEFLANQGFDFNKFIYEGVPLLRAFDRDMHVAKADAEDAPGRPEMSLAKPEDRALADRLIAQVTEWLKASCLQTPNACHEHSMSLCTP